MPMLNFFDLKNWWREIDKINFILISTLLIVGIILSFSLNDSFLIFNKHLIFALIAFLIMIYISSLDSKILRRLSFFSIILFLVILIVILFIDYEIKGSKRWLKIFGFSLQPSEFIKPFYIIVSSWFIVQGINGRNSYLFLLVVSFIIITGLIILQPDFGMTFLIFLTFFCQLFIAGLSLYLVFLALFSILILSFTSYLIFDHVQKRVNSFIAPSSDFDQINLSIRAFKSGGLFGKGPGQGTLKENLPDANTDFIFAVAGEELGFYFLLNYNFTNFDYNCTFFIKVTKNDRSFL